MDSLQEWQTYLPGFQFSSGDALEFACGSFYLKKHKAQTARENFCIYSIFCMHNYALCNAAFVK